MNEPSPKKPLFLPMSIVVFRLPFNIMRPTSVLLFELRPEWQSQNYFSKFLILTSGCQLFQIPLASDGDINKAKADESFNVPNFPCLMPLELLRSYNCEGPTKKIYNLGSLNKTSEKLDLSFLGDINIEMSEDVMNFIASKTDNSSQKLS